MRDRKHFRLTVLNPLVAAGMLEPTIPDKPRSRNQRYRTTEAGLTVLRRNVGNQVGTTKDPSMDR